MADPIDDAVVITYSVKDLLAIQGKSLERIERKVDESSLHQVEALARLDTRVALLERKEDLEPRVRALEGDASENRGEKGFRRYIWPTVAAIMSASWWLPYVLHHHF